MLVKNLVKSPARKYAVDILEQVFVNSIYADEALALTLDTTRLSQRDKSLLVELVNGVIRWRVQLDWILRQLLRGKVEKTPVRLLSILEMSLYQIRFLDKIPQYAAVSEGVEMAKREGGRSWGSLVNGVLRSYLRNPQKFIVPMSEKNPVEALSIQYSHPQWMIERWVKRYGQTETERLCEYNNRRPLIAVRINRTKATREFLLEEFLKLGIDAEPSRYFDDFILLRNPHDLSKLPLFQKGLLAIQDESTAIPCRLLSPQKGETVLDMCAAPGGKTCYLAHLANDEASIIALDKHPDRLRLLRDNVARFTLKSVFAAVADGVSFSVKPVDKILLDAPCSGLGVLARRADLRWRRTLDDIFKIQHLQKALLKNADRLLKPGGVLVYSTCTIEPEENEVVIGDFLDSHPNYAIDKNGLGSGETFLSDEGFLKSLPQRHLMDGSFAVKLIKQA